MLKKLHGRDIEIYGNAKKYHYDILNLHVYFMDSSHSVDDYKTQYNLETVSSNKELHVEHFEYPRQNLRNVLSETQQKLEELSEDSWWESKKYLLLLTVIVYFACMWTMGAVNGEAFAEDWKMMTLFLFAIFAFFLFFDLIIIPTFRLNEP